MALNKLSIRQKMFFRSGKTKSIDFRLNALRKIKDLIENNERQILETLHLDLNKCETEAYTSEIYYVLNEINYFIKKLAKLSKEVRQPTPIINWPAKTYFNYEPYGVVLIIAPYNYPVGLLFTPMIGAIAAGNCIIAKPSELTPNTSNLISKLIAEAFSEDYISVIQGDKDTVVKVIDENINYIFFTGGSNAGREIMKLAANYLIPSTMELGGENPCIVDYEIDIKIAVERIVWSKFFNAGQTCVAPNYIWLHESVKEEFVKTMIETINRFFPSDDWKSSFSKILSESRFNKLCDLINSKKVITGGIIDKSNLQISPTLVWDEIEDEFIDFEIFGPILPIRIYKDLEDVVQYLNSKESPLGLYFFSKNKEKQEFIKTRVISGSICFNGVNHILLSPSAPFGGVGKSGFGVYHGKYSFETFSRKRTVVEKSFLFDNNFMYPPYKTSLSMIKKALKFIF